MWCRREDLISKTAERSAPSAVPGAQANRAQHLQPAATEGELRQFREWIREVAGISMSEAKHALVLGRLTPRMREHGLSRLGDYFRMVVDGRDAAETQLALDLLTTNETHFFRELRHFDYLRDTIVAGHPSTRALRVWSAACSSGEEPYSIAMTLDAARGGKPWEVFASDVSTRVLQRARAGHYPMARAKPIPDAYLRRYCLKGVGPQQGTFIVDPELRKRVQFQQVNLNVELPRLGTFDVIFLRNIMIYFDLDTKRRVATAIARCLSPNGYLIVGHSESLNGIANELQSVAVSIYRRV